MTDAWAERLWTQLERIATGLETLVDLQRQMLTLALTPEPDPAPPTETSGCPHPPEHRVSFGMTHGQEEWECRLCQTRSP